MVQEIVWLYLFYIFFHRDYCIPPSLVFAYGSGCICVCAVSNRKSFFSSSNCRLSNGSYCVGRKVSDLHCLLLSKWGSTRKGCLIHHDLLSLSNGHGSAGCKKNYLTFSKAGRSLHLFPFATSDDGMTVNGSAQADTDANLEKMRVKLDSSLEDENFYDGLVQALNDAARVFELAIKEHKSYSRVSWFSTAWLGVDQTAWVKALSCQVSSGL